MPAALVLRDKGGVKHMGEKGKDGEVALCLLDGGWMGILL
jgi:hypothetical protein